MLLCIIKITPGRVSGCLSTKTKNKYEDIAEKAYEIELHVPSPPTAIHTAE